MSDRDVFLFIASTNFHLTLIAVCFAVCSTHWSILLSTHDVTFAFCSFLVYTGMTDSIEWASSVGANA